MVGQRTRVALEREKMLALKSIKELEFDRAMGKLSDADWAEMSGRLRARAARIMKQLDAGVGYRDQIERDLQKRLGERFANGRATPASAERECQACSTANDADARFCKSVRPGARRRLIQHNGHEGHKVGLAESRWDSGSAYKCDPLCPWCPLCWIDGRACPARRLRDARSEADVGHSAAGGRSAERRHLGPPDPRFAVEQHPEPSRSNSTSVRRS